MEITWNNMKWHKITYRVNATLLLLPGSAIADLLLLEVSGCVVTPENLGAQDEVLSISLSLWQWAGASTSEAPWQFRNRSDMIRQCARQATCGEGCTAGKKIAQWKPTKGFFSSLASHLSIAAAISCGHENPVGALPDCQARRMMQSWDVSRVVYHLRDICKPNHRVSTRQDLSTISPWVGLNSSPRWL